MMRGLTSMLVGCRSGGNQDSCSDCDSQSSSDDEEFWTRICASKAKGRSVEYEDDQLPNIEYPTPFTGTPFTARSTASTASQQLPEYEYPAPFTVRNTFIDEESELERIRRSRELHSTPARFFGEDPSSPTSPVMATSFQNSVTHVQNRTFAAQAPPSYAAPTNTTSQGFWVPIAVMPLQPQPQQMPMMQAQQPLFVQEAPVLTAAAPAAQPLFMQEAPVLTAAAPATQPLFVQEAPVLTAAARPGFTAPTAPVALSLADALAPQVGTPECPTVGSAGHYQGTCKPCAFFHTKGCDNGPNCPFCHLCDSNERKKRVQEKRQSQREERQRRRESTG